MNLGLVFIGHNILSFFESVKIIKTTRGHSR